MTYGRINEVFRSIQGEGVYAGCIEQVFIRFAGCNLKCKFCDTKHNEFKNYTPELLVENVLKLSKRSKIHSVSITGGEPLLQIDFLVQLCIQLKKNKLKIYLETNGVMHNNLSRIVRHIDYVAMDFKLPSSTGANQFWIEHSKFLRISSKKNVFVKAVITPETKTDDVKQSISIIKQVNKNIPLILQPASRIRSINRTITSNNNILEFMQIAKKHLNDVRIIPQLHKIIGVK